MIRIVLINALVTITILFAKNHLDNYLDGYSYHLFETRYEVVCLQFLNSEWEKLGREEYVKKYPDDHEARVQCARDDSTLRLLKVFGY